MNHKMVLLDNLDLILNQLLEPIYKQPQNKNQKVNAKVDEKVYDKM